MTQPLKERLVACEHVTAIEAQKRASAVAKAKLIIARRLSAARSALNEGTKS